MPRVLSVRNVQRELLRRRSGCVDGRSSLRKAATRPLCDARLRLLWLFLVLALKLGEGLCFELLNGCVNHVWDVRPMFLALFWLNLGSGLRLKLQGRCVTHDYGFLGCSSSVLDLLDRACSGRRWCHFDIPTLRDLVHPCPKDLTCYLEATYRCVTGAYVGSVASSSSS